MEKFIQNKAEQILKKPLQLHEGILIRTLLSGLVFVATCADARDWMSCPEIFAKIDYTDSRQLHRYGSEIVLHNERETTEHAAVLKKAYEIARADADSRRGSIGYRAFGVGTNDLHGDYASAMNAIGRKAALDEAKEAFVDLEKIHSEIENIHSRGQTSAEHYTQFLEDSMFLRWWANSRGRYRNGDRAANGIKEEILALAQAWKKHFNEGAPKPGGLDTLSLYGNDMRSYIYNVRSAYQDRRVNYNRTQVLTAQELAFHPHPKLATPENLEAIEKVRDSHREIVLNDSNRAHWDEYGAFLGALRRAHKPGRFFGDRSSEGINLHVRSEGIRMKRKLLGHEELGVSSDVGLKADGEESPMDIVERQQLRISYLIKSIRAEEWQYPWKKDRAKIKRERDEVKRLGIQNAAIEAIHSHAKQADLMLADISGVLRPAEFQNLQKVYSDKFNSLYDRAYSSREEVKNFNEEAFQFKQELYKKLIQIVESAEAHVDESSL